MPNWGHFDGECGGICLICKDNYRKEEDKKRQLKSSLPSYLYKVLTDECSSFNLNSEKDCKKISKIISSRVYNHFKEFI